MRVLLSTGSKESLTLELFGTYTCGEAIVENGILTVTASKKSVTVKHSEAGTLVADGEIGELSLVSEGGYVTLATASDKVRKYTGSMTFYAEDGVVRAVNSVSMTEYICGVAVPEVGRDADENLLKVALLTAKGFALAELKPKKTYDVRDTTSDQLYYGYFPDAEKVLSAAEEVSDLTLLYEGKTVKTHYGSANGGVILTPKNRWGGTTAYEGAYACKYDPFDLLGSEKNLTVIVEGETPQTMPAQLYAYLSGLAGGEITKILSMEGYNTLGNSSRYPAAYAPQDGFKMLAVTEAGEKTLDVSFDSLTKGALSVTGSISFVTKVGEKSWRLCFGNSSGPRVGISHRGAAVMAAMGYDYVDILAFYYPGGQLTRGDGSVLASDKDLSPEGIIAQITGEDNGNITALGYLKEAAELRQTASASAQSSGTLPAGCALGLYKKSGSFYKCMDLVTGVVGYVPASLIGNQPVVPPVPTQTPVPAEPPSPSDTPEPTETPKPAETPEPVETLSPTDTPEPAETPSPTDTPEPVDTPKPTETPTPTDTPAPSDTPTSTDSPTPSQTPACTPSDTPESTDAPTPSHEPSSSPLPILGDADGDGVVTAQDAACLLRYLVGLETLPAERLSLMDVDGDGAITAADAAKILQYVVGLIKTL